MVSLEQSYTTVVILRTLNYTDTKYAYFELNDLYILFTKKIYIYTYKILLVQYFYFERFERKNEKKFFHASILFRTLKKKKKTKQCYLIFFQIRKIIFKLPRCQFMLPKSNRILYFYYFPFSFSI